MWITLKPSTLFLLLNNTKVLVSGGADVDPLWFPVALHLGRHHRGFSHDQKPGQTAVYDPTHQGSSVESDPQLENQTPPLYTSSQTTDIVAPYSRTLLEQFLEIM